MAEPAEIDVERLARFQPHGFLLGRSDVRGAFADDQHDPATDPSVAGECTLEHKLAAGSGCHVVMRKDVGHAFSIRMDAVHVQRDRHVCDSLRSHVERSFHPRPRGQRDSIRDPLFRFQVSEAGSVRDNELIGVALGREAKLPFVIGIAPRRVG